MSAVIPRGSPVIFLTLIVALMLTSMPLPTWAEEIRPHWVLMVIIYWSMALPHRVNIGVAWIMGLLLDVSYDAVLGQYALAMAIVAYFTVYLHQRLRIFPVWQQAIVVFIFCLIYDIIVLWIKGITGIAPSIWMVLLPCFTTAVLWTPVFMILRKVRRVYGVN